MKFTLVLILGVIAAMLRLLASLFDVLTLPPIDVHLPDGWPT